MTHISGHEPAEQMVSIMFQGIELTLRLGGEGIKTLAQMIYASTLKESNLNMRSGRVRQIAQLLRENKPLTTDVIPLNKVSQFKKQAKKFGILYALVKDTKSKDEMCTVIIKEEESSLLNDLLHSMDLKGINTRYVSDDKKKEYPSKKASRDSKKSISGNEVKKSALSDLKKHKETIEKTTKAVKIPVKSKDIGEYREK